MLFKNRFEAGEKLARKLKKYSGNAVVLAIPRGGLEVGRKLADELHCQLDCLFSKKIPLPFAQEVAIGAVTRGSVVVNENAVAFYNVDAGYVESKKSEIVKKITARDEEYHENFKRVSIAGKTVILTDDGIATGETIEAAILYLRKKKVKTIVLAVPVAPPDVWEKVSKKVNKAVCLFLPVDFQAVGQFYENFLQVTDEEARRLLEA